MVGRLTSVPESLLAEAERAVRVSWSPIRSVPALLDPAHSRKLGRDSAWKASADRVVPHENAAGFSASTLIGSVAASIWLAHRLPAGDPLRGALPDGLTAVRDRLAQPGLMLSLGRYLNLPKFRKAAGAPSEIGEGFERYGAVVLATQTNQWGQTSQPAVRPALLDAAGRDPYLPALRGDSPNALPLEVALVLARDPGFAALLDDPGDPAAGERAKDGTWWPQDPTRSVPDLVAEVAAELGLEGDVAALYLMLLAMPDPTDRNTARWTGWKPARLKAARTALAATALVVEANRPRAGRSLFLPGGWIALPAPDPLVETWKRPLLDDLIGENHAVLGVLAPTRAAAQLYRSAWARVRDGDIPRFEELNLGRAGRTARVREGR
jgi:hypothetical protein